MWALMTVLLLVGGDSPEGQPIPKPALEPLAIHLKPGAGALGSENWRGGAEETASAVAGEACRKFSSVSRQLKKQHGKKEEVWPEAAQSALKVARDSCMEAVFSRDYKYNSPKHIADATDDLRKALTSRILLTVERPEDAVLIITVQGRNYNSCVGLEIGAGGLASEARFRELISSASPTERPSGPGSEDWVESYHDATAREPYWWVSACRSGTFRNATQEAKSILERLARRYYSQANAPRQP